MTNEDILIELKNKLKECTKNKYDFYKENDNIYFIPKRENPLTFNFDNVVVSQPRVPNQIERNQWLIHKLKIYHFLNRDKFTTTIYRCLKGMVRKGDTIPVFRYLEIHWNENIRDEYQKMCNSETIVDISEKITFVKPVCAVSIECMNGRK